MPLDPAGQAELRAELVAVLEAGRAGVRTWLEAAGQPPVVSISRAVVEPHEDRIGWGSGATEVPENVLLHVDHIESGPFMEAWLPRAQALAEQLDSRYRATAPAPFPFPPPGLDLIGKETGAEDLSDPLRAMLLQFVLAPTRWYVRRIPSVADGDLDLASQIADEVLSILGGTQFRVRQRVGLDGLRPVGDLVCGNARLRALTPLERGESLRGAVGLSRDAGGFPDMTIWVIPVCVLEVDAACPSAREFTLTHPPRALVALDLHQFHFRGVGAVSVGLLPEWYSPIQSGHGVPMRKVPDGEHRDIASDEFAMVCATAIKLEGFRLEDPQRTEELALRRFSLGCSREDHADALVDFVVALEALLLPGDSHSEMRYRFCIHGSHFIGSRFTEREELFDRLRTIYDARSSLVHGEASTSRDAVANAARSARDLAARGLLRAVHDGFPDAAFFRRAVLGGPDNT